MKSERKVILYIAMSLDGYIAKPDGNLDFLTVVEEEGQDYGYATFIDSVDTVIIGRKTYDKIISLGSGFPHNDKEVFVITRTPRPTIGSGQFYTGNLKELIMSLKSKPGTNIFVDGGAEIVNELLKDNLIDEFYISIIPVLLGEGISLFKGGRTEMKLELISSTQFDKGLVQLHYERTF